MYQTREEATFRNGLALGTRRRRADASLSAGHVSLADVLPVDDVPDGFQIVGPDVFVLQVVRVLPHVDAQQRNKTCRSLQGVLVRTSSNLQASSLLIETKPAPACNFFKKRLFLLM